MGKRRRESVSLRDYLEALRAADKVKERDDVVRGRERIAWMAALALFAWSETQRRLEQLNHENERLLKQQASTVSADTYQANEERRRSEQRNLEDWRKEVDLDRSRSVTREEFQRDTKQDRREQIGTLSNGVRAVLAVGAAAVALIGYQIARTHPVDIAPVVVTQTITTSR